MAVLSECFAKQADSDFAKDLYKLMKNAVFGKTMENVRKRVDIRVMRSDEEEEKVLKYIARPTFKRHLIFDNDLVGIENRKVSVTLNKPVYVGMSVLELSKWLMYDFYYNLLKPTYPEGGVHLLYTDTDSFILHFRTDDIYDDIKKTSCHYDTSNYPADHPAFSNTNKKVVGKFKDELGGKLLTEFVGLRSKMYSYAGEECGKRAKGVKKSVLKKAIVHEDYRTCLFSSLVHTRDMPGLRSHAHRVYGETVRKVALAPLDTKRYILQDGVNTLAFGHVDIGRLRV